MFANRTDAGRQLARALIDNKGRPAVVYALPRGGVVCAVEVARALEAPLDLIVARKIGHPQSPEYAIGAVTEEGDVVLNPAESGTLDLPWLKVAAEVELREARRRRTLFLGDRAPIPVDGKIAIVVDDGLATGLTMEAAVHQLRKRHPETVIVAVPVAATQTVERLRWLADQIVVLHTPKVFEAVGLFYRNFNQVSDDEVVALLKGMMPVTP